MDRIFPLFLLFALLYNGPANSADSKPVPITATSWLVADGDGKILQSENIDKLRPIASITKLVTAMTVLDAKQDLDQKINQYTRRELIELALVHSKNDAAQALCENYPGGKYNCLNAMNTKLKDLGLKETRIVDPTGLGVMNVSTARELISIVQAAKTYPEIVRASNTPQIKIKLKKKWLIFKNTNPIIGKRHNFIVSKTGFINAAGGCIVMMLDTDIGRRIVVVLGSKNTHTRIPEAEFIATKE